jgi:selenoprotein W-related protein
MKVQLVYCVPCNHLTRASGLATTLLDRYGDKIEQLTLVPADGGRFEVSLDGTEVFNKKIAGRFPETSEIAHQVEMRLGGLTKRNLKSAV